jgi:streptogramin lyase
VGPDGNLWFAEYTAAGAAIARITPSGALTKFSLPKALSYPGALTAGPDGNLWFTEDPSNAKSPGAIVRITPSGALTKFSLTAFNATPGGLTVGPDGNLWFVDFPGSVGRIGRIDPTPPHVTKVVAVAHPGKAITSILLRFDGALDPGSASKGRSYSLAAGVANGPTIVFNQKVRIAQVTYNRAARAVRLKLAVPQKGPVQVTVRAGLVAADGMSSSRDFTAVIM